MEQRLLTSMREEALVVARTVIKEAELHRTAPETERRLIALERTIQEISEYNQKMLPIMEGLHDAFVGGKVVNRIGTWIVKFLVIVGAISGSILWIKEWIKR